MRPLYLYGSVVKGRIPEEFQFQVLFSTSPTNMVVLQRWSDEVIRWQGKLLLLWAMDEIESSIVKLPHPCVTEEYKVIGESEERVRPETLFRICPCVVVHHASPRLP